MIYIYIYNTFLTVLYTAAMSFSLTFYLKERRKTYLLVSFFFLLLIINNLIITLSEYFYNFASFYNYQFMINPILQTLYYLGAIGILFLVINELIDQKGKNYQYALYVFFAAWLIFIPFLQNSALKVWLYYLPSQLIVFYLGFYLLKNYEKNKELPKRMQTYAKVLGILAIVFAVIILLEDTFVIFFKDVYDENTLGIQNRNISENIFHITLSLMAIRYFLNISGEEYGETKEAAPLLVHFPENNELETSQTAEENEGQLYFEQFIENYHLTPREAEVLFLLLQHKQNQEIASELYLSLGTVKTHTHNIFIKLSVEKRSEVSGIFEHFIQEQK